MQSLMTAMGQRLPSAGSMTSVGSSLGSGHRSAVGGGQRWPKTGLIHLKKPENPQGRQTPKNHV